jgi:hypothetical protein
VSATVLHMSISLDGFIAGPNEGPDNPTGDGGYRLQELTGAELERGIEVFGRLSEADVGRRWDLEDVQPPSLFRLYRATVSEHYVLIAGRDPELGTGVDRREPVTPAPRTGQASSRRGL